MPIFQDDLGDSRGTPPTKASECLLSGSPLERKPLTRKASEESIRTDLCEGPVPDSPEPHTATSDHGLRPTVPFTVHGTSDRVELIERLKKGQSPTWLPNRSLGSLLHEYDRAQQKSSENTSSPSPPLPSAEVPITRIMPSNNFDCEQVGLQIERPRSALHSGDFTQGPPSTPQSDERQLKAHSNIYNPKRQGWFSTSPPRDFPPFQLDGGFLPAFGHGIELQARSRAPSLSSSYSSSFVMKPPTSPLVQSESNEDLELSSHMNPIDINPQSRRNLRRQTLQESHSVHSTPSVPTASSFNRPLPHLRRDNTFPYQAHQPRRSLNLNSFQRPASPQPPGFLRSRRPSYTPESSPRPNVSMVGSYEESIIRGRMSTTPSKPLDFVAQIGVLGLGKCKPSLRCPPHVTIPFPAVFYSYDTTSHSRVGKSEDGPSPYVGQIDLENNLPHAEEARDGRRKRLSATIGRALVDDLDMDDIPSLNQPTEQEKRRVEKQKRRSTSPRAPPGGSYRIPEKGQLQIIIKNPNKTAVKLFLVPYDLSGMEPGTKTFIRQRSYSAGPVIDTPLSSAPQAPPTNTSDRPTLRYLVHLHICSPSRGRFYLYKSIRVVFANRVPDGKEKLRNEISLPEPKYSTYKPGRDSNIGNGLSGGAGVSLAAEKAFRRRSSGFGLCLSNRNFDAMDGISQALERGFSGGLAFESTQNGSAAPIQAIPFSLFRQPKRDVDNLDEVKPFEAKSPSSSKSSQTQTSPTLGISSSWNSNSTGIGAYDKLHKGDVGYGGNVFNGSPNGKQVVAESLLAKKLRGLGVASKQEGEETI